MGKSSSALLKRAETLKRKITPPRAPRQWTITLEEGEDICEELRSQLGKYDTVFVRYFPKGYLGDESEPVTLVGHGPSGQVMSCWTPGPRGRNRPTTVRQYQVDISNV